MLKQDSQKLLPRDQSLKMPPNPPSDAYTLENIAKSLICGGTAGMVSKTFVAPLDRIKILLQGQNPHYKSYGIFTGLVQVIRKEGFLGLYKGNGAQMVRVFPYAAVQFVSYEGYKRLLGPFFKENSQAFNLIAGGLAGVTSVVATYPLDLVRARITFAVGPTATVGTFGGVSIFQRSQIVSTLTSVFRNEGGIQGLYRGLTPALAFIIPYAGLNFYMFEKVKYLLLITYPKLFGNEKDGQIMLTVPGKLVSGGLAGSISQSVAYPLDVARRRMQLSFMSEETKKLGKGVFQTLYITYRDHGIVKGLYRGMTINYIRATPLIAVNFATYETLKQLVGLRTGISIKTG